MFISQPILKFKSGSMSFLFLGKYLRAFLGILASINSLDLAEGVGVPLKINKSIIFGDLGTMLGFL